MRIVITDEEKNEIISRIVEIELVIMGSLFKGHKAHNKDQYQILRDELKVLRGKLVMNEEKIKKTYNVKLKHSLTDIVLGEKVVIPQGEIILSNINEETLSLIEFPITVKEHGNGIKTLAQKTDCIIEEILN